MCRGGLSSWRAVCLCAASENSQHLLLYMYKWLEPLFRSASCEECSRTGGKPGLSKQCRVLEAGLPDLGWSRVLELRGELPAG